MLDKILRTLKAKGEAYSAMAAQPGTDLKTDLKILSVVKDNLQIPYGIAEKAM